MYVIPPLVWKWGKNSLEWSSRWCRQVAWVSIPLARLKLLKMPQLEATRTGPKWRQNEEDEKERVMMQDTEWKQGKSVRGEHTGIGRGCRGPPQCSTVHEKTERRNKNRQHANSQQRDDRVKAYTARHHGRCCECSEWSVLWRGKSRGWTGDGSKIMAGRHANWYLINQKCSHFHNKKKRRWREWVEVGRCRLKNVCTNWYWISVLTNTDRVGPLKIYLQYDMHNVCTA